MIESNFMNTWCNGKGANFAPFPLHHLFIKVGLGRVVLFRWLISFSLFARFSFFLSFFFFFFSSFFPSFLHFFSFPFLFFSRHIYVIVFHVIFILSASLPSRSRHFHTRHLRKWRWFQTALYTSDIQISSTHIICYFTSVCPFVRCCVEDKICTLFCLVLPK